MCVSDSETWRDGRYLGCALRGWQHFDKLARLGHNCYEITRHKEAQ